MKLHDLPSSFGRGMITTIFSAVLLTFLNMSAALASDISPDSLRLALGVVKAPGYEMPATAYVDANPASIYSDHLFFSAPVNGELKRGEHVDVLAKVKGWDWALVSKDGTGIGYVSISMLSHSDIYVR